MANGAALSGKQVRLEAIFFPQIFAISVNSTIRIVLLSWMKKGPLGEIQT
jgi:hypothetical protein